MPMTLKDLNRETRDAFIAWVVVAHFHGGMAEAKRFYSKSDKHFQNDYARFQRHLEARSREASILQSRIAARLF